MTMDVSFAWKKKMYSQFQTGSRPLNHFPRLGGFFFFFRDSNRSFAVLTVRS